MVTLGMQRESRTRSRTSWDWGCAATGDEGGGKLARALSRGSKVGETETKVPSLI